MDGLWLAFLQAFDKDKTMNNWHKFRGILALIGIVLNTLILCPILYIFVLLRLILPFEKAQVSLSKVLVFIAETWIANNNAIVAMTSRITWTVSGMESLDRDQWYLVTCNHQSWADILVLQRISNRRIPFLKFFLKQRSICVIRASTAIRCLHWKSCR